MCAPNWRRRRRDNPPTNGKSWWWRRRGLRIRGGGGATDEAARLTAIERLGRRGGALPQRPLLREAGDAVLSAVKHRRSPPSAGRRLAVEVVERVGKVPEPGQLTDAVWDPSSEAIVGDIELLEAPHPGDRPRQWALEVVESNVEDGGSAEQPDLWRKAPGEVIIEEDYLV